MIIGYSRAWRMWLKTNRDTREAEKAYDKHEDSEKFWVGDDWMGYRDFVVDTWAERCKSRLVKKWIRAQKREFCAKLALGRSIKAEEEKNA